ncbi:hypothetical protein [uncultured Friedmanniella sp.]|uniref:hypothetical protein n=1 Tax=uncultured Friedmanniella sp. TaxID=335381 RepID=UPI0035CBF011
MPLAAPVDRSFRGGVAAAAVPTPAAVTLNGTQPTYVADGLTPADTAGQFNPAAGVASYWRETFAADSTSPYGQLTTDFILHTAPTSSVEIADLAGSGAVLSSALITTTRLLGLRDANASSSITGWVSPQLALDVPYRLQQAIIKGTSTTTGSVKAQLIRLTDGAVIASGLSDGTANAGAVSTNGAIVGKRNATGTTDIRILSYRVSNQAFDYLGDIPAASSGAETFETGAQALGFIGDSTTDRSGSGGGPNGVVEARIVANGQGWTAARVRVNGLTSRTINFDNGVHPTGVEQVAAWRAEGFDPGTWALALGGNGGASDQAQQQTWIGDILTAIAAGPQAGYRVILFGFSRLDPANADAARFWAAMQAVTPPAKIALTRVDYNSLLHNGRSETGLWQSASPTEPHMTTAGYLVRDQIMVPFLTAPPVAGGPLPPAWGLRHRVAA